MSRVGRHVLLLCEFHCPFTQRDIECVRVPKRSIRLRVKGTDVPITDEHLAVCVGKHTDGERDAFTHATTARLGPLHLELLHNLRFVLSQRSHDYSPSSSWCV